MSRLVHRRPGALDAADDRRERRAEGGEKAFRIRRMSVHDFVVGNGATCSRRELREQGCLAGPGGRYDEAEAAVPELRECRKQPLAR